MNLGITPRLNSQFSQQLRQTSSTNNYAALMQKPKQNLSFGMNNDFFVKTGEFSLKELNKLNKYVTLNNSVPLDNCVKLLIEDFKKLGVKLNQIGLDNSPAPVKLNILKDDLYRYLRGDRDLLYSVDNNFSANKWFEKIGNSQDNLIKVMQKNSWTTKQIKGASGEVIERVSGNLKQSPELIDVLDDFIVNGVRNESGNATKKVKAGYMVLNSENDWNRRHDPVHIFFSEPVTKEIKDYLAKVLSPFARSESDILSGARRQNVLGKPDCSGLEHLNFGSFTADVFAPGLAHDLEPTAEKTNALLERVKKIDHKWYEEEIYDCTKYGTRPPAMSAGKYASLQALVDSLERMISN